LLPDQALPRIGFPIPQLDPQPMTSPSLRPLAFSLSLLLCAGALTQDSRAAERPHIILILVDDMGFSDLGYHGGEIETPHLDALARGGVRFSQFYNSGRCCPTRATLLTGLHPHQTGIGWMTQPPGSDRGKGEPPAYQGYLNRRGITIGEVLRRQGYATLMAGKWHLGMNERDRWPLQRGFEKYYGCLSGATRFFHPDHPRGMTSGNEPVEEPVSTTGEAFYTTDAFTDHAIRFLEEELSGRQRPVFLYLAYTAPHWPLQAFEDDVAKYRGTYRMGWDKLRRQRYQRQIELGLIDPAWKLSPKTPGIPDWDDLEPAKQDEMDLKMAVYAAMIDRIDQNIGRLVAFLKQARIYEDTLLMFLSDNGACQEGGILGRGEFFDVSKRNLQGSNSYGEAWANASSTPFRLYKHFAHEGGTATPFFLHWPERIQPREDWYREPAQIIDVLPTILDVAGADYPERFHGADIPALDGISLRPAFDGQPLERSEPIFVEHETNAFVRDGNWKLVGKGVADKDGVAPARWELYDMEADRTETNDLAADHPERVARLAGQWDRWAKRVNVYPKGEGGPTHGAPQAEPNPPAVGGRPFTVRATVRQEDPQGVILAHGGLRFGYSLYFDRGRPAFAFRNEGELTTLTAPDRVQGTVSLTVSVDAETISLAVNGEAVARVDSPGLLRQQPGLGLYLGEDFRDPVGAYRAPHRFNGRILDHDIEVTYRKVTLRTPWGEEVDSGNVWKEYPRPSLRRETWFNLNGYWDYAVTGRDVSEEPSTWDGRILVPFALEAPLSEVEQRFQPDEALWYRRTVNLEKRADRRYRLNFEAVDYESTLWINGRKIGSHTGGNLPFSFDVTKPLREGENEIVLRVTDATDTAYQLHGKQRLQPRGIWYTPVSGIWQTVWLEEVPETYVRSLEFTPRINGKVSVAVHFVSPAPRQTIEVTAFLGGTKKALARVRGIESGDSFTLEIPDPQLWSPQSPTLYDLTIRLGDDVVRSYLGLRETGLVKGDDDHWRFTLNDKPIFHWGTLDQGWWPDGLLTPPSDEAMVSDIEFLKAAGFNTIRKHIKVEPRRFYSHCDRLGMLVWQDQVSSMADNPDWTRLQPDPPTVTWPRQAHAQFMKEFETMMVTLHNHPCIVQWVPFNERWGQHQTMEVGRWTEKADPTRQVNIASGGNWFPVGQIVDAHKYPHPEFPFDQGDSRWDRYVKVMGEFGGHGFPVEGHLWSEQTRNWGYGGLPKDKGEWLHRYRTSIDMLAELKKRGIAAGIYTQTSDVEGEINGLITYDRKAKKVPASTLREISRKLLP